MRSMRRDAILDIYQLLLAVFLFVSPWLFAFVNRTLRADDWLSAALVAVISFTALVAFREWQAWINFILGMWISASPWILGFQPPVAMRINLAIGLLISYLAIFDLWLIHYGPPQEHRS